MPYINQHTVVLTNPNKYDSWAQKEIAPGIKVILGIKNGKSEVHSYRFDRSKFTIEQVRAWLKVHNITDYISIEPATGKGKIQAFIRMECQAFSPGEITTMIPKSVLEKIKEKDPHPFFQAYSICHEGDSKPKVLGQDESPLITWTKKAIQSIKNILFCGTKFFRNHNDDNSTIDRKDYGEVIAEKQTEINGKLHHIVIGYFPDKEMIKDFDINSMEAEWDFIQKGTHWIADKIYQATGIALGSSNEQQPAFPDARRLASVQAFNDNSDMENIAEGDTMDLTTASFSELVQEMQRRKTRPADLFTFEEIKEDRRYASDFQQMEDLKKTVDTQKTEIDKLKKTIDESKKQSEKSTAGNRLDTILKSANLTEQKSKFIKEAYLLNPDQDSSDEGLKKYADETGKIFDLSVKLTGGKVNLPPQNTEGNIGQTSDITTPKGNEFLTE